VADIFLAFLSILFGGAITFLASRYYYLKASEDLRGETEGLRRYNKMLMHFLDDAGVIDVEWDPDTGEPMRVVYLSGVSSGVGEATGTLTVGHSEGQEPPAEEEDR
jgi:hypothetical protein